MAAMSVIGLWLSFVICVITGVYSICPPEKDSPTICMPKLGCLSGTNMPGFQTDCFEGFMGIPYAKPPVGNLRLANPVPIDPWEGVLDVKSPKADCIQKNYLLPTPLVSGEEDCLYLNVYRPITTSNGPLPVMVYIHGGGFFAGSANPIFHGPEYFMDTREVILVTMAYRLGALGFLSTGDENCPGNFGLKDQVLALKWVQNNIRAFNGDPDNVTIFGQSAGAASVHMHMLSSASEGLFHRAIVMSGNAAAPYNKVIEDPLSQARKQAELSGIKNARWLTTEELIKILRKVDAATIVNAGDGFKYWHVDPLTTFRPVIEENYTGAFLTADPVEIVARGNFHHVPWMVGYVPYEGAVRALSIISNEALRNDFNSKFESLLPQLMELESKPKRHLQWKLKRLVEFYLNGTCEITKENGQQFGDMITDRAFTHPLYKTIKSYISYADLEKNPVYIYKFNYRGPYSYSMVFAGNIENYGVVHCDDLIYLFKSPALFPVEFDRQSTDAKVIKAFVDMFVSFAKFGEPKKFSSIRPCNPENFRSKLVKDENAMCDYQEIKNNAESEKGFSIETNNYYDLNVIRFWDEILN